jgi:hypothetical protein
MTHLLPLFTNINSINIGVIAIMRLLQNEYYAPEKEANFLILYLKTRNNTKYETIQLGKLTIGRMYNFAEE